MVARRCFAFPLLLTAALTASAQETPTTVYLEREPLALQSPSEFQVPIALAPLREVTLTATTSGPVQTVLTELGGTVASQAELVRIDSEEAELLVKRAQAALDVAKAGDPSDGATAARIALAEIDLDLAQLRLKRSTIIAPFDGKVSGVSVVASQYVREATPLVTLVDDSTVTAVVPVDRSTAKVGETIPLDIEGQPYDGRVKVVLPLSEKFEPLRDLFQSVACAVVEFDNAAGVLSVGQTVRSPLIPRDVVTEVPNGAVSTDASGERRVFVIRNDIAVSVPIAVLSPVGQVDTMVAGAFKPGDEVVTAGAEQLVDGRRVVPAALAPPTTTPAGQATPGQPPGARPSTPAANPNPANIGGF